MALGLILCWEQEPYRDFEAGVKWILRAAELGGVSAQYFVAVEYATGENISQNIEKAAHWYEMAAKSGHAEAQYNLALMYWQGEGVDKDVGKAQHWLLESAKQGELFALRVLSEAYEQGQFGFPQDVEQAKRWTEKYETAKRGKAQS